MKKNQNDIDNLLVNTPGGKRPLTDLERCLLLILKKESGISSDKVLELASHFKMCATCSDRNHVFSIGERLVGKKLVSKSFEGGVYYWYLTENGRAYSEKI